MIIVPEVVSRLIPIQTKIFSFILFAAVLLRGSTSASKGIRICISLLPKVGIPSPVKGTVPEAQQVASNWQQGSLIPHYRCFCNTPQGPATRLALLLIGMARSMHAGNRLTACTPPSLFLEANTYRSPLPQFARLEVSEEPPQGVRFCQCGKLNVTEL